jgi:hypothetical protein
MCLACCELLAVTLNLFTMNPLCYVAPSSADAVQLSPYLLKSFSICQNSLKVPQFSILSLLSFHCTGLLSYAQMCLLHYACAAPL